MRSTSKGHSLCVIQRKTVLVAQLTLVVSRKPIGQGVEKQDLVRSGLFFPRHARDLPGGHFVPMNMPRCIFLDISVHRIFLKIDLHCLCK